MRSRTSTSATPRRASIRTTHSATPKRSAWIDAAPNLRHYGCTHGFCDRMGIGFLEAAAAATNLETLDLAEWGAQDDETTDGGSSASCRRCLRIFGSAVWGIPGGDLMFDNAIGDALRAAAHSGGAHGSVLKFSLPSMRSRIFDASSTRRPCSALVRGDAACCHRPCSVNTHNKRPSFLSGEQAGSSGMFSPSSLRRM